MTGGPIGLVDQERQVKSKKLPPRVTALLLAWRDGEPEALAELMPLVCDDLRRMARRYFDRGVEELQPTALVNELFLHFKKRRTVNWRSRAHFFGFAAQTMRRILVDHIRTRHRQKRGSGEQPLTLEPELERPAGKKLPAG